MAALHHQDDAQVCFEEEGMLWLPTSVVYDLACDSKVFYFIPSSFIFIYMFCPPSFEFTFMFCNGDASGIFEIPTPKSPSSSPAGAASAS